MHQQATPLAGGADRGSAQMIQQSHARSAAFGLHPHESIDPELVEGQALSWMLDRNAALCAHARPVMEALSAQIAGSQSMVLLTDAQGVVLHALGDDDFLDRASRVALRPGATWSERSKGTNAIGTALALGEAVHVQGREHFLQANHFLSCACAPILDARGQVLGALDVSGDRRGHSPHTLALVRMSARLVENQVFGQQFAQQVLLRFHARAECLGTLVEGLMAFTPEGRFVAANRSAQLQLGLSLPALQAHTFGSLFDQALGQVLQQVRQSLGGLQALVLPGGGQVVAQVLWAARRSLPVWGEPPAVAPAPVPTPASADTLPVAPRHAPAVSPSGLSGLRYLNTGDAQLAQVIDRVTRVLGHDVPILILGETGTGKELLARAIHQDGPRHKGPFVAVNCASIPETLIEAELFGYEEGAFTGARRKGSTGKLVQAHAGTLFLDEIGDMPLSMQARLLRVLQERSVAPLGSVRQVPVDLSVVCATHRNLRDMVAQGQFREDLYYRLNGLVVRLPALRERSDLAVIVERLLRAQAEERGAEQPLPRIAAEVMALFAAHAWPGNLRQLANVLRTASLMAGHAGVIARADLPEDFLEDCSVLEQPGPGRAAAASAGSGPLVPAAVVQEGATAMPVLALAALTRQALQQALVAHGGNVSAAARSLGVSRNTVYRRLREAANEGSVSG